jgi:hypothetical protein
MRAAGLVPAEQTRRLAKSASHFDDTLRIGAGEIGLR